MQLISALRDLDHHQRQRLSASLNQVGDGAKVFGLIEACFEANSACPHCASADVHRYGCAGGLQRPRCQQCHKTFNALTTGTPLARLRDKPKWLAYLAAMKQSLTVRQAAADTGIHRNTSFRWRHRFLSWISQDRPSQPHGITEADETYLLESGKGKRDLARALRKRGGSATKRGIPDEQICVLVARDRAGQTLGFVMGNGALTKARLTAALKPKLAADALLVSGVNPTYTAFCEGGGFSHETVNLIAKASASTALTMCKTSTLITVGSSSGWHASTAWLPITCQTTWAGGGLLNSIPNSHRKLC